MKIWVFSGRPSDSANLLSQQEGFGRLRTGKGVRPKDIIVNWGTTKGPPVVTIQRVLNNPGMVGKAINKRTTFQILAGANVATVPWTANMAVAKEWLDNGLVVVARKTLTGSEGAGIVIVEKANELIEAPLYTQYINKVKEFRVHATQYGIIDTQQKVHDPKLGPPKSWKVRSYANGFIFQRKGIIPNLQRDALAIQTVKALGLDFGGLDIIEDKQGKFYVVECNTAPGIEGQTVGAYAGALRILADHLSRGGNPVAIEQPAGVQFQPNRIKPYTGPVGPRVWAAGPKPEGQAILGHKGLRNLNLGWAA